MHALMHEVNGDDGVSKVQLILATSLWRAAPSPQARTALQRFLRSEQRPSTLSSPTRAFPGFSTSFGATPLPLQWRAPARSPRLRSLAPPLHLPNRITAPLRRRYTHVEEQGKDDSCTVS